MEGKIKDIEISKRSGIQKIVFEDGSFCLIENGGLRDLIKRLGNPKGQTIEYQKDEFGIMVAYVK